ncbi:YbhB/YbcL family Raf kinase inhibitor-like protein [bacterium]|nr:YbhB/YbcL family Raf kinase inhibitor-like protein [bacterium]
MKLTSSAFVNGGNIPSKYTCDDKNISPPLEISDVPKNAEILVLIMDDPDAPMGTFVHWVVWNIPKDTVNIPEGTEPAGVQGITDFGKTGYGAPCPPSGTHSYRLRLYALNKKLELKEKSGKKDVEIAMEKYIIESVLLTGKYKRS